MVDKTRLKLVVGRLLPCSQQQDVSTPETLHFPSTCWQHKFMSSSAWSKQCSGTARTSPAIHRSFVKGFHSPL